MLRYLKGDRGAVYEACTGGVDYWIPKCSLIALRLWMRSSLLNQSMNEFELLDDRWCEHERIKVFRSNRPVHAVHGEHERQPGCHDAFEIGDRVGIEIDLGGKPFRRSRGRSHLNAEVTGHLERIDNMEIVRPTLGKIL